MPIYPMLENYTLRLYDHLRNNRSLRSFYLPHSDVYYTRNAIYQNTGVWLECKEVQELMEEMGWDKH